MTKIHRKQPIQRISSAFCTFALVGLLGAGCDSDDDKGSDEPTAGKAADGGKGGSGGGASGKGGSGGSSDSNKGGSGGSEDTDAGMQDGDKPDDKKGLYALAVEVYNPDNTSNTYLTVTSSLDIKSIDMKAAKELAGRADAWAYDGKLFITSDESPTVKRYTVSDDGKLSDEKTLSFATLGVESTARLENVFISKTKAYLGIDGGYAIWNPDEMKLGGQIKVTEFPAARGDMTINGSVGVLRGDKIYKTIVWIDWSTYTFSKEQFIAVFDTKTDKLIAMESEEHCPALTSQPTLDADGNLYFSNWFFNVPSVLIADAPKSCVVRIPKDADKPDDWKLEFDKIASGHEGSQLSYTDKGQAVFSVFHQEDVTVTKDTDPQQITSSLSWETWTLDLKKPDSAKAIAGVARAAATQTNGTVDGRTFVYLPNEDYSKTKVFEILPDAKSRAAFEFDGTTFVGFVKIK